MDKCQIDYSGFVSSNLYDDLERVDCKSLTPEGFFENYISKRKPVIISNLLKCYNREFRIDDWTNNYLKEKAGECDVLVEKLQPNQKQEYGYLIPKVNMKYGEFIDGIIKKEDKCYMTTQDVEKDASSLDDFGISKKFYTDPLTQLKSDFPVRLTMAGNLVPNLISLWHGFTRSGSSTGLHHDFDDNIYILIRGRKRFRIFPPSCIDSMKTAGKPLKVFENGLVTYQDDTKPGLVTVRSDGVPLYTLAKKRLQHASEQQQKAQELLEETINSNMKKRQKKVKVAALEEVIMRMEEEIDEAMDEMLLYGGEGSDDGYSESDADGGLEEEEDDDDDDDDDGDKSEVVKNIPLKLVKNHFTCIPPKHFCSISLPVNTDNPEDIFKSIGAPEDAKDLKCLVANLNRGDALYLPASWFHEVSSFSSATDSFEPEDHLALNYWFYPPDNSSFQKPYKDNFWEKHLQIILKENV